VVGYCPSADNPVDLLTRCIPLSSLQASVLWKCGPEWVTREDQRPTWSPMEIFQVNLISAEAEVLPPDVDKDTDVLGKVPTSLTSIGTAHCLNCCMSLHMCLSALNLMSPNPQDRSQLLNFVKHRCSGSPAASIQFTQRLTPYRSVNQPSTGQTTQTAF